jgi:hypothetical protein
MESQGIISDGCSLVEGRPQDFRVFSRKGSGCKFGFSAAEDMIAKANRKVQSKALKCPLLQG